MSAAGFPQAKRANWLRMTPPPTRRLADAISASFLPPLTDAGFLEVACWYGDRELTVSGREIRLERPANGMIDSVHIAFDKYRSPRLQISVARRDPKNPIHAVRGANITKSPRKYYSWWGKPWWLSTRLWSEQSSAQVAEQLVDITPQILAFLERGQRGANIGRSAPGIAY